jgi:hypothetical protein
MNTDKYEGHTPGPWKANITLEGDWAGKPPFIDAGDTCVARIVNGKPEDARLIAAIPELLEELKRLQEVERWAQTHHAKCEEVHGAECVPSEAEVELYDRLGKWEIRCEECDYQIEPEDSCSCPNGPTRPE